MGTVVYNLYAPNLICIGIDGGNNGEYTGRIWHQYSDEPLSFQGTMEMVRSIENLFNQWNFPQSSTDSRSFSTKKPVAGEVQGKGV